MPPPRIAVLFRTHFWDDYALRAAVRIWEQSAGTDFYVQADETSSGPIETGPFRKIGHSIAEFEQSGLPCAAPAHRAPLWWNCDYGLLDAIRKLPEYDWYLVAEYDVAVNLPLRPLLDGVIASGAEALTFRDPKPVGDTWPHRGSCADMPYPMRVWTALPVMFVSRSAGRHLLEQRLRLAAMLKSGALQNWPFCEVFFASALACAGYRMTSLRHFAAIEHFGAESIYLEGDPRCRIPGSLAHSVLDVTRFWAKMASRSFGAWLSEGEYAELQCARDGLARLGQREHPGWRITASGDNLALDRPARQSSVSPWSRKPARGALDPNGIDARGANCGVLNGRPGFHTAKDDRPWWAVDLQRLCHIREVRIYNSHKPARARALVVESSLDGEAWTEIWRKPDERVFAGPDDPLLCRPPAPVAARQLRVLLPGEGYLHLDEVEVLGRAETA